MMHGQATAKGATALVSSSRGWRYQIGAVYTINTVLYVCAWYIYIYIHIPVALIRVRPPGVFYTCFYNHARRLRLEKLLYLELPTGWARRSPNGFLNCFWARRSETAVTKPFRK
jgi:hypothetical protein